MIQTTLFPPQQEVLNHGILDLGFSSVLSLSTGAGKTTLAEMGMDRALIRGERVAYLTPLKALAEEKITSWRDRWPGRKVGIFTGDYEASAVPVPYRDAEVLICTYERFDGILRYWQRHLSWLSQLGLVVVDEFHLLMDPSRGPRLEGALSRLRRVNPFCRVMGLSATVSNHADLAAWLDGVSYHNTWRAVPLEHEVRRFKRLADKADLIIDIVAETASDKGQTLVFASSRRRAEHIAAQVSAAGYSATHHHAGLSLAVRRAVESDFRAGLLACLVATPTLEMGLNLPCRTVVIADNTRWNGESFEPLPVWNYLQRAGRAGRPGQDGAGRAILLAPTWARGLQDYGRATPEPIRSRLTKSASLAEQILIEVASRSCRTKAQLAGAFLPSTLAFRQEPSIADRFTDYLDDLLVSGLMSEDQSAILHPSLVGWVAVRHQLSPATAKHLLSLSDLEKENVLTIFDLLLHHCWDGDLQPQLPVSIEVIAFLEDLIRTIPSYLLDAAPPASLTPRACAAGVLMATLAWHYVQGKNPEKICEFLDVYVSDAEVLRQNLVRLLQASSDLHQAIDPVTDPTERQLRERFCGSSLASRIRRLGIQLEHGLPGDAVYLTLIPGCGGRFAQRLLEAGITDLEDLCNQEPSDLAVIPGIGPKRAQTWIEAAERLIKAFEPDTPPVPPCRSRSITPPTDWPSDIDPGRLQRASMLKVDGSPRTYWVSGGAEEHCVQGELCDCADFAQHGSGWWCKHRLAVRLANKDRKLKALADRLANLRPPLSLAGHLADLALGRRWQHV
jgi:helicase